MQILYIFNTIRIVTTQKCIILKYILVYNCDLDVPGPVTSEPVVKDAGRNWLTLSWTKPEHRGTAPVVASVSYTHLVNNK